MAVDLGTTRTRVAVGATPADAEVVVASMASRVARLEGRLVAGPVMSAVEAAVEVKPLLGVRSHVDLDGVPESVIGLAAELLRAALADAFEDGGAVVLTHPVAWLPERRSALRDAAVVAGIGGAALVTDAEAVAWVVGADLAPGEHVAVHDLGADTFQTSVLRRTVEGFTLAAHPGSGGGVSGRRLDERLLDHVLAEVAVQDPEAAHHLALPPDPRWALAARALLRSVQRAKELLSVQEAALVEVPDGRVVEVTRSRFDDLVTADLALARDVVVRAVQRGEQVAGGPVTRHAVVGGCSLDPALATMLDEAFAGTPVLRPDPFLTVVRGALDPTARAGARPIASPATPAATGRTIVPVASGTRPTPSPTRPDRRPRTAPNRRTTLAAVAVLVVGAGMGTALWQVIDDNSGSRTSSLGDGGRAMSGETLATPTTSAASTTGTTATPTTASTATPTTAPPPVVDGTTTVPATEAPATTAAPAADGYWLVSRRGGVLGFGIEEPPVPAAGMASAADVVAAAAGEGGVWLLHSDGFVTGIGVDALIPLEPATTSPHVGIAATHTGLGYWTAAADGTVLAHGDAPTVQGGPPPGLTGSIVAIAPSPTGGGYWLASDDGTVYAYGSAAAITPNEELTLAAPIVGIAATPGGKGYWLAAEDGGVFAFGDAQFYEAATDLPLNGAIVGITGTRSGKGYLLAARDGGVFAYGDATFESSFPAVDGAVDIVFPVVAGG